MKAIAGGIIAQSVAGTEKIDPINQSPTISAATKGQMVGDG